MQVTKDQINPCTVSLEITIEAADVSAAFEKGIKAFSKVTSVPGFRPGKAPKSMVEAAINKEKLKEYVVETIAPPAYQEAVKQEAITPFADPEVDMPEIVNGQDFKFSVVIPLEPIVKLGSLENIKVDRPVYTITDEDVEGQVQALLNDHARLKVVEDRPVVAGDVLIAEIAVTVEGEEPAAKARKLIRLGDNIPGFEEAVVGAKVGDTVVFDLVYPEDYHETDKAGKPVHFDMDVVSIHVRELPELTDEFVASVTEAKSVEQLREVIRSNQENSVVDLADRIVEGKIIEEIIDRSELQFPDILVEQEKQEEYEQLSYQLEERNLSYEDYLDSIGMTEIEHQTKIQTNAVERVKTLLVLRDIAAQNNVEVSREEIALEFSRLATQNNWTEDTLKKIAGDKRRVTQVGNMVVRRKLRSVLFELAEIKDVPAQAE